MTVDRHTQESYEAAALLVRVAGRQFGLPLAVVERVLPMAYVLSLPEAGQGLVGMLNLHGEIVPVVDPRPRLGLPSPTASAEQRLVALRGSGANRFLLWVDEVDEVVTVTPEELSGVPAQQASPVVPRVLRLGDAIVPLLAPTALEPRVAALR
jgi:chemotaxis signal transduction protein